MYPIVQLAPTGTFFMVAGGQRHGVPNLVSTLEKLGFDVDSSAAPSDFLTNPLKNQDEEEAKVRLLLALSLAVRWS